MKNHFIVIAEDDADDRFLIQSIYDEQKFEEKIEFLENGEELINYLVTLLNASNKEYFLPDYIMLDLNMPKKDGREVLKELKQHPILKKIPIIVFTTTSNKAEITRCYELGANTYVIKPTSFNSLQDAIHSIRTYWLKTAAVH